MILRKIGVCMKLSILDQVTIPSGGNAKRAIEATIELASLADEMGYERYWIAEHHDMNGLASPAPDLLLGIIGAQTKGIRLGAGAVLLPYYKPFQIAERYNVLATLYPNRIDLGIGRAPGGSAEVSMALSDNYLQQVKQQPQAIDQLLHFLNRDFPKDNLFSKISPAPVPVTSVTPWLLGTSEKSAILAAEKGMKYVFGHFMSDADGPEVIARYNEQFQARKTGRKPESVIAVSVICAPTNEQAEEIALSSLLWKLQQAKGEQLNGVPSIQEAKIYPYTEEDKQEIEKYKKKMVIGDSKKVKEELLQLQKMYRVDELMIITITHDSGDRLLSYQLLMK